MADFNLLYFFVAKKSAISVETLSSRNRLITRLHSLIFCTCQTFGDIHPLSSAVLPCEKTNPISYLRPDKAYVGSIESNINTRAFSGMMERVCLRGTGWACLTLNVRRVYFYFVVMCSDETH